jgi:hypothetical protein
MDEIMFLPAERLHSLTSEFIKAHSSMAEFVRAF